MTRLVFRKYTLQKGTSRQYGFVIYDWTLDILLGRHVFVATLLKID